MKRIISMLMVLCMSTAFIVPAGAINISTETTKDFAVEAIVSKRSVSIPWRKELLMQREGILMKT